MFILWAVMSPFYDLDKTVTDFATHKLQSSQNCSGVLQCTSTDEPSQHLLSCPLAFTLQSTVKFSNTIYLFSSTRNFVRKRKNRLNMAWDLSELTRQHGYYVSIHIIETSSVKFPNSYLNNVFCYFFVNYFGSLIGISARPIGQNGMYPFGKQHAYFATVLKFAMHHFCARVVRLK